MGGFIYYIILVFAISGLASVEKILNGYSFMFWFMMFCACVFWFAAIGARALSIEPKFPRDDDY